MPSSSFKCALFFLGVGLLMVDVDAFSSPHFFKGLASSRSALCRFYTGKPRGLVKMTLSPSPIDESTPVEHRGVPAEHQGLHTALYGDGDDHGVSDQTSNELFMSDVSLSVAKFLELSKGKKAAGVFSIADRDGNVKFISFTRSLHASLSGVDKLASLSILTFGIMSCVSCRFQHSRSLRSLHKTVQPSESKHLSFRSVKKCSKFKPDGSAKLMPCPLATKSPILCGKLP
jgi:hypothetical protein